MHLITVKDSSENEKNALNKIFEESKSYFNKIEGRTPLRPLVNIESVIPGIANSNCHCLSVFYLDSIIGYLWLLDDSSSSAYILHFYISKKYRNFGFGKLAIKELENRCCKKQIKMAELVVSANNYVGLKFWHSVGFDKIANIYDENKIGTNSIEIELQKQFTDKLEEWIHFLPVNQRNAFLGNNLAVTKEQINSNLVLSVPEGIKNAFENEAVEHYFICLNNTVIGYTSYVFDQTIPNEEDRYWLWQFIIDKRYQGRGYGTEALKIIVEHFRRRNVPVITLSTKANNFNALKLYEKFGFTLTTETNGSEIILKKFLV